MSHKLLKIINDKMTPKQKIFPVYLVFVCLFEAHTVCLWKQISNDAVRVYDTEVFKTSFLKKNIITLFHRKLRKAHFTRQKKKKNNKKK